MASGWSDHEVRPRGKSYEVLFLGDMLIFFMGNKMYINPKLFMYFNQNNTFFAIRDSGTSSTNDVAVSI